jgi:uncharacterized membrane protein YfcA
MQTSKILILAIGAIVGFLSGLLGKGGSAITTPALQIFARLNPFSALASPLPATLPTALSASLAYRGKGLLRKKVILGAVLSGIPATLAGSYFSDWLKGNVLMIFTAVLCLHLAVHFLFHPVWKEVRNQMGSFPSGKF